MKRFLINGPNKGVKGEIGGQGIKGILGPQGDKAGLRYQYSHNTGMSDPGTGIIRYDNSSSIWIYFT